MQYSHHNAHLRYQARERDLIRLRNANGLLERLARSLKRR
jgi:hypothetical protein